MAYTDATLTQAICDYTQNFETGFVANIPQMIITVEDRISKAVILPMNRKNVTLTITNNSMTATLPEDFLAPFELRMVLAGEYTPVDYVDVSFMRSAYPNPTVTGTPRWYSMYDPTSIIMAPTPTAGLSGWLNYFHKPESITTAGTSWLGTNAEDCLLYGCLSEAYTYMKGEPDIMKTYEDRFQAALVMLQKLGEGMDLGDAYRMGERRISR